MRSVTRLTLPRCLAGGPHRSFTGPADKMTQGPCLSDTHNNQNTHTLNFGPVHPAAHGVLRIMMEMDGLTILHCDPMIGYLHRGTEKLMENKTCLQSVPYLDRLDYCSPMSMEHGYAIAVETLLGLEIPLRASFLRVMMLELTRIMNHLLAMACHAADVGGVQPILWGFDEREKIMDMYQNVSGSRMHPNWIRPGGVANDVDSAILYDIYAFLTQFASRLEEIEELVTGSRIFRDRLIGIGALPLQDALSYGATGPVLRASGHVFDLRVADPYEIYPYLKFNVPFGVTGDAYDRLLCRFEEMRQSMVIVHQCLQQLPAGEWCVDDHEFFHPGHGDLKESMEALIYHFLYYSQGYNVPNGSVYRPVEAPKGEFGCYIQGNGTPQLERISIRSPAFYNLATLDQICRGYSFPDLVALLSSLDPVFGEVDR